MKKTTKKTTKKKPSASKKKFSWKTHFEETFSEYRKFFIALLAIMGIALSIGVVRAIFVREPCAVKVSQAVEKKLAYADISCEYK